ncbi:MAG: putative Ig domain-containing protein [Nitrospiraceae bacterium]|nr:putative Ig domain-containing protein [Nitrospiraceae bacterium]
MRYNPSNRNMMWTVLLLLCTILSLNGCSDANNVTGPPAPALPGPLTILTSSPLPAGTRQASYDITLAPSGGTPPYTWSLTPGSPSLPTGLVLNQSTGTISGTPTSVETKNTEFRLQDSKGESVEKVLPITVNPFPISLAILTNSLPSGVVSRDYAVALGGTGGTTPYTWGISNGSLPVGLNLDPSGVISGQPTTAGTFSPTFQLQDSGNPPATVTKSLSITITLPAPPKITTTSLPPGTFNGAYAQVVSATGGSGALTWAIVSGGLPPGLNLNTSNGNISGALTQTGSFPFTVRVTDQLSRFDEQDFTITVNPPVPPTISGPASLPSGTVNQAYPTTTLTASGGTAPLIWDSTVTPALPNGLSWDATTHTISGTPLIGSQGTTSHVFTVRDSTNPPQSDTKTYSLTIVLPAPPRITTTSLPNGNVGTAYSQQLQATGGSGNLTWTIIAGALPLGLGMDTAGLISGIPIVAGAPSAFTVQVTDALQSVTQDLSIEVFIGP